MPDATGAARARTFRARRRGDLPPVPVCSCGRKITGDRAICRQCWLRTPEGKEWNRQRIANLRAARRKG